MILKFFKYRHKIYSKKKYKNNEQIILNSCFINKYYIILHIKFKEKISYCITIQTKEFMKKTFYYVSFFSLMLFLFTSCDLIKDNLTADVEVVAPDIQFNIGEGVTVKAPNANYAPTAEFPILDKVVDINLAQKLKDAGYNVNDLKAFTLKESTLKVISEPTVDLSVLKKMKLYLKTNDKSKLVASVSSIDNEGQTVKLKIENSNVLEDLLESNSIHVIMTCDVVPTFNNLLRLSNVFTAKVAVIKD